MANVFNNWGSFWQEPPNYPQGDQSRRQHLPDLGSIDIATLDCAQAPGQTEVKTTLNSMSSFGGGLSTHFTPLHPNSSRTNTGVGTPAQQNWVDISPFVRQGERSPSDSSDYNSDSPPKYVAPYSQPSYQKLEQESHVKVAPGLPWENTQKAASVLTSPLCFKDSLPPSKLFCMVCGDLFKNPVLFPTCGHTFCHGCVHSTYACPTCQVIRRSKSECSPNLFVGGEIEDLEVYCKYAAESEPGFNGLHGTLGVDFSLKPGGCTQLIKLHDKQQHEKQCEFQPWSCHSCHAAMRLRDRAYHYENCAIYRHLQSTRGRDINQDLMHSLNIELAKVREQNRKLTKEAQEEKNQYQLEIKRLQVEKLQWKNRLEKPLEKPLSKTGGTGGNTKWPPMTDSHARFCPPLRQDFAYTRFNIKDLCQFLVMHVDDLGNVVGNRIHRLFDCINTISKDLSSNLPDNPPTLNADFVMLLSICLAMPCWSEKQKFRFADFKKLVPT